MTSDTKGSSYNKRVSVVGHRCFICGFFYAQDVRYFARGMEAGSDYAQDVRYFAGGMEAGSDYAQDVRYFARGMDAGSDDAQGYSETTWNNFAILNGPAIIRRYTKKGFKWI